MTWQCSCTDAAEFREHCLHPSLEQYRTYPNHPGCWHERFVALQFGGLNRMVRCIDQAPLIDSSSAGATQRDGWCTWRMVHGQYRGQCWVHVRQAVGAHPQVVLAETTPEWVQRGVEDVADMALGDEEATAAEGGVTARTEATGAGGQPARVHCMTTACRRGQRCTHVLGVRAAMQYRDWPTTGVGPEGDRGLDEDTGKRRVSGCAVARPAMARPEPRVAELEGTLQDPVCHVCQGPVEYSG